MEMPECSICFQPFDEEDRTPRSLSCGHSPCQACLQELPRRWTDSSNSNCVIRCPECNQWNKLPRQGITHLPKNIELLRFIDALQQFHQGEVKPNPKTQNSHLQNIDYQPSKLHNSAPNSSNSAPISNSIAPVFNNLTSIINKKALNDRRHSSDWTDWIIPQEAIQLRTSDERENDDDGVILIGRLMVSSPFREQVVGLMPLGPHVATCPSPSSKGHSNSYSESITRVVESLVRAERQELKILMIHSLLNRKVCRLFGFWMSCEGLVYLVYEKLQRLNNCLIQSALKSSNSDLDPIPRRWLLNSSSKRATEICELVVRLHSQSLICGCLAPEIFELDEFGYPMLSLTKALLMRRRLKDQIKNAVNGDQCTERKQMNDNMSVTSSLMYLSPEVLSILYNDGQECISDEITGCSSDSISDRTTQINYKSDVWSLGCFLLMLLVGESPFDELSFDELLRGIVIQKFEVYNWLDEKLLSKPLFSTEEGFSKNQIEKFKHLLGKCFEYEPKNRPDAHDLWMCLSDWSTYTEHPSKGIAFNSSNQGCWCLVLGESVSTLATEIEFYAEKGTMDARLQKHNQGNEFKDIHSNESRLIGGGKFSAIGGTELKMDELKVVTLEGHFDCVTALATCGEFLLSASYDKTVHLWSLHTNSHVGTLRGHAHRILALAVNLEESLCFSGDYGGCIFVWDIGSSPRQEPLMTWYDHKDWRYTGVHALAISKDGYLYSGSGDRTVKAWSLQDYSLISTMEGHKSVVSALFINEGLLYSGSWDGTIHLWWLRDHSPLAILGDNVPNPVSPVQALAMCNDTLVAVYNNGWIQIWKDDLLLKYIQVHETAILALDGKDDWIFTGGLDKTIKAFNIGEITEDPFPIVIQCNSVVTSLLVYHGKLLVGFADKVIKVTEFC